MGSGSAHLIPIPPNCYGAYRNMTDELVFVYGSLKTNKERGFLQKFFKGKGHTQDKFGMVNLKSFPGLIRTTSFLAAQVEGELYKVPKDILDTLDFIEGHPNFYRRELLPIMVDGSKVTAWVYLLSPEVCQLNRNYFNLKLMTHTNNFLRW